MKIIKLTNYVEGRQGDPIYINAEHIITVYEDKSDGGSVVTKIYGGAAGLVWSVEESLNEVIKLITE